MTSILDICLAQQFRSPRSPREYLALQIARKLNDLARTREYAVLLEHFPEHIILGAFRRAQSRLQMDRDGFLSAFREATLAIPEEDAYE